MHELAANYGEVARSRHNAVCQSKKQKAHLKLTFRTDINFLFLF